MTASAVTEPTRAPVPAITLRTAVVDLLETDAFDTYRRLRSRYRVDEVFLLESLAGDEQERRTAMVGFGPVLGFAVRGRSVELSGCPAAVAAIRRIVGDLVSGAGDECRLTHEATVWDLMRRWQEAFTISAGGSDPALVVVMGYDAAGHIERLRRRIPDSADHRDLSVQLFQGIVEVDLAAGSARLELHDSEYWPALDPAATAALVAGPGPVGVAPAGVTPPAVPAPDEVSDESTEERFCASVRNALEHIARGDIYQVQLGHEVRIRSAADPWSVYLRLRARNPSPYMSLIPLVNGSLMIGASPELFVRVEHGRITMRPVAGTLPHGRPPGADVDAASRRLREDPKETAEHRMLVDLCRNDIGRVCAGGTLTVPVDRLVTRYSHVLHLVSAVEGDLDSGHDAVDVLTAAFPAGTMTGAPKIRAMEIIEELETSRRGLYAGAVGLMRRDGSLNTALCIRSVVTRDGEFHIRASAGVVADSEPEREWAETVAKLGATYWAVTGEELS
jgi:anthranilate synthase component 1